MGPFNNQLTPPGEGSSIGVIRGREGSERGLIIMSADIFRIFFLLKLNGFLGLVYQYKIMQYKGMCGYK